MLVITFRNTTALAPVSDYDYEVWVTTVNGDKHIINSGQVVSHKRSAGWAPLVERMLMEKGPDKG